MAALMTGAAASNAARLGLSAVKKSFWVSRMRRAVFIRGR